MSAKRARGIELRVKRIYEPPSSEDGLRVLVDRLWPRGIRKDAARIDIWLKDVAPSDALRRRAHSEGVGEAFAVAYARELEAEPARSAAQGLLERVATERVTLLYASRDTEHNNAVALRAWLEAHLAKPSRRTRARR